MQINTGIKPSRSLSGFDIRFSSMGHGSGRFRFGPEWNYPVATVPYNRLYFMESGCARVTLEGREYSLRPGNAYLIPCRTAVNLMCPDRMKQWRVHFSIRVFEELDLFEVVSVRNIEITPSPTYQSRFRDLLTNLESHTLSGHLAAVGILTELLHPFVQTTDIAELDAKITELTFFAPALQYMRDNLTRPVTLEELAATMDYSPDHFVKRFRAALGCTPYRFFLQKRIDAARHYLATTSMTIQQISKRCGFNDPLYFARLFRKYERMPPARYRKLILRGLL